LTTETRQDFLKLWGESLIGSHTIHKHSVTAVIRADVREEGGDLSWVGGPRQIRVVVLHVKTSETSISTLAVFDVGHQVDIREDWVAGGTLKVNSEDTKSLRKLSLSIDSEILLVSHDEESAVEQSLVDLIELCIIDVLEVGIKDLTTECIETLA